MVELAEAEALAKEAALAAPGAKLERPLPLYLLGEYRHEGKGKERTLTLKLRAERAGKPVGKPEPLALKPDEAPSAVRKWSAAALDALAAGNRPRPPADPAAEAKQLATRATTARRLGYWEEAIALVEAALLVDPTQVELHLFAVAALGDPLRAIHWHELSSKTNGRQAFQRFLLLYRRGLEHLEAFIDAGGDPSRSRTPGAETGAQALSRFRGQAYYLKTELVTRHCAAPEGPAMLAEAREFERALFSRLLKSPQVATAPVDVHMAFVVPLLHNCPAAEQYAAVERLLAALPDVPGSADKARRYIEAGFSAFDEPGRGKPAVYGTGPAYEGFKARVTDEKSKFAAVAKAELARLERQAAEQKAFQPPAPATTDSRDVRLTAVELEIPTAPGQAPRPLLGLLAAGAARDVAWDNSTLYLMKEKGKLVRVPMPATWSGAGASVVFDGKYVWASTMGADPKVGATGWLLTVTDPTTGRTWDLTKADGLPESPPQTEVQWRSAFPLAVAPLGPGRVCVVGSLGRAWVAVLTFDPAKGGAAKVIHEAREAADRQEKDQWKSPTVAFFPGSVRVLTDTPPGGKPVTRVLIGRIHRDDPEFGARPLLVDPDRGAVEVVGAVPVPTFSPRAGLGGMGPVADGKLYFQEPTLRGEQRLLRLTASGSVEPVAAGLPRDVRLIHPDGQRFHAVEAVFVPPPAGAPATAPGRWASNWWTVEPGEKRARFAHSGLPALTSIGTSSHYGLFALGMSDDAKRTTRFYTVEVATPSGK